MHSFVRMRNVLWAGLMALALSAAVSGVAAAKPRPGKPSSGFRLFARSLGALTINRIYCGLSATGEVCVDSTNSSTIGGGFWPKGTPDQYVFNSGIQVAGIVDPAAGFAWAGDTTGGQLFNPRGDNHGEAIEPIYNMSNPADFAFVADTTAGCNEVCRAAKVPAGDPSETLYNPLLRGRASASQGDVWFVSWEGNPSFSAGRKHPLGILVEQRGLGWNFPSGNNDILYFVYTFYNVTAKDPAVYATIRPGMQKIVADAGVKFQQLNEQRFGLNIPDGGYTITNMFAAFGIDADVADAGSNYASVNVPFALGYIYESKFQGSTGWQFDPAIFGPPFFPGAGFVGVKYLKSPINPVTGAEVGLTLYSNTINQGAFDDASNQTQLWRYLSGNISTAAGDAACNTGNQLVTHICYVNNDTPADMRFFQSSGPLTLAPGAFGSVVVAYVLAPPRAVGNCTGPATCGGGDQKPGDATRLSSVAALAAGANKVDSVAGYNGFTDINGDGKVQQDEIKVVPGSLYGKALTAQAVFNNRFLLPFAPDAPNFFLIPGNGQVTVLWQPSASETTGDPFFAVASQPTVVPEGGGPPVANPLFDPNYRRLDVEGYRVYRGRVDSPNALQMIAQFDYAGTLISDFTGGINPVDNCAPEIGVRPNPPDGTCLFDSLPPGVAPNPANKVDIPLAGQLTQTITSPAGSGRAKLATGKAILLKADTAITGGGAAGCPAFARSAADCALRDTGVPFVFEDKTPRNNLRYFYAVTAFDINSFQSGPSSLESPRNTKSVIPVATATNYTSQATVTPQLVGRGQVLNVGAPLPTIDPTKGTFSGPFPPANGWNVGFASLVSQVLAGSGAFSVSFDSLQLGSAYQGVPHQYWFTASAGGKTTVFAIPLQQPEEVAERSGAATFTALTTDNTLSTVYGGNGSFTLPGQVSIAMPGPDYLTLWGRGCVNTRPGFGTTGACAYNGSRWFAGPSPTNNETQTDPIGCNTANFSGTPMPCYNNAGALPGVTTIYQTQCYQSAGGSSCRALMGVLSGAKRAADYNFYWGAAGKIDSVVDVTHNVLVPYDSIAAGSWGILNVSATAVGPGSDGSAVLTNADISCVEPIRTYSAAAGFAGGFICPPATPPYRLKDTAVPGTVGFFSGGGTPPAVPITNGASPGFAMYVAGDMFTFELTGGALPAPGTVWSLRQYAGVITGGNGAGGNLGPYAYVPPQDTVPQHSLPLTAVGTTLQASFSATNALAAATTGDLSKIHTVPDPYYITSAFEQTTDSKIIKFVNLPAGCIIRIYSSSGVLVSLLEHRSATFGGSEDWNVRNRNNQVVASGVYFYHIESGGARRVGRFTVVNFAQ